MTKPHLYFGTATKNRKAPRSDGVEYVIYHEAYGANAVGRIITGLDFAYFEGYLEGAYFGHRGNVVLENGIPRRLKKLFGCRDPQPLDKAVLDRVLNDTSLLESGLELELLRHSE